LTPKSRVPTLRNLILTFLPQSKNTLSFRPATSRFDILQGFLIVISLDLHRRNYVIVSQITPFTMELWFAHNSADERTTCRTISQDRWTPYLLLFSFTRVQKQYAFCRNHTLNFEFSYFPKLVKYDMIISCCVVAASAPSQPCCLKGKQLMPYSALCCQSYWDINIELMTGDSQHCITKYSQMILPTVG
jgi:hypothetical protein